MDLTRPSRMASARPLPVRRNVPSWLKALETARKYPLLVIDGCRPRCASALAAGNGIEPAGTIWVAEIVAREKLSLAGENRKALGEKGMRLARAIADEALTKIDLIIAEDMMSTL